MEGVKTGDEPAPARKRGPYAKSLLTRKRAVHAAIEIFSVSGFHGATLTEVAERLGMTLTGLQHHFPDKDALLAAVLEERDEQGLAEFLDKPDEDPTELLLAIAARDEQNPRLTELHAVLSAEATSEDHPAHDYFVRRYERQREAGARYFRAQMDRGELGVGVDPRDLASLLIAVADGLQLQWLLDKDSVDMATDLRRFLTIGIPAIAAGAPVEPRAAPPHRGSESLHPRS